MAKQKDIQEIAIVNMAKYGELLEHVIKTGDTMLVLGNPGMGKSQRVHEVAAKLNKTVRDIRLSQFTDGGDLIMKVPNGDMTAITELVFNRLPQGPGEVLFLDEFAHADETVKKAMFQLIHDRKLGPYELPPDTPIIAAGNEGHDMMSPDISSPLLDRFTFRVKLQPELKEFTTYIKTKPNGTMIMGYLNAFSDNFYVWPEHGRVLMTPRRWEKVCDYYPNMTLIQSIMPPGVFDSFQEFSKKVDMFRDIELYIDGKKKCPEEPGDQWAIYTASMSLLGSSDGAKFDDATFKILDENFVGMGSEIQATLVLDTLRAMLGKKKTTPTDLMARLPDARKQIFRKVVGKYQFTSEGVQQKV